MRLHRRRKRPGRHLPVIPAVNVVQCHPALKVPSMAGVCRESITAWQKVRVIFARIPNVDFLGSTGLLTSPIIYVRWKPPTAHVCEAL